jgi:hypothetical protein
MVIDSIQLNPLQLPFQAWPMMMTPAYGAGGPLAPQGFIGSPGSFYTTPMMLPWGGQPAYLGGQLASQAGVVPFQSTVTTEQQAIDSLMQTLTAGPIRKLHDYLEAHSQKYGQLAHCIPVVQQAAKAFGTRDYMQALLQLYQVYRYIAALRASIPDLPSV